MLSGGAYLLGGVSLSGLGCLDGEEDKLGLVFLQTLDVQLKSLDAPVATPGVNADANGLGLKQKMQVKKSDMT